MSAPPKPASAQPKTSNKRSVGITTHILVIVFALSGVIVQFYVPRMAEPLQTFGEQPLPFLTVNLLHFQHFTMALAALLPAAAILFAIRSRFTTPLSKPTIAVLVLATVLEGATAYALLAPMQGLLEYAASIKPTEAHPAQAIQGK
jgi:hypothetical protein